LLEEEIGVEEVVRVRQEIDDAIYDLEPLQRPWL
jgi:hypothetical protein